MKNKVLALLLILFPIIISTSVKAQYVGVTTVQPAMQALIEKKILNPQNNEFVDNLNIEQHTFLPDQEVIFRVTVTNAVQSELKNLQISDKLPDVLNFVSTSFGNYDKTSKSINLFIDILKTGESKTFEIKTKVKAANELPNTLTCQTNLSRVTVLNVTDEDTATFCISKKVLGVSSQLPVTGPSQTTGWLLLSAISLAIGLLIRRIIFLEGR